MISDTGSSPPSRLPPRRLLGVSVCACRCSAIVYTVEPRTVGMDAFQRKFGIEAYRELALKVTRADATSIDGVPDEDGFACEAVELRDTEEGKKWRRCVEEEEVQFDPSALQGTDVVLLAVHRGCTTAGEIAAMARQLGYRRKLDQALHASSAHWAISNGAYSLGASGMDAVKVLLRDHAGLQEALDAAGDGEEEAEAEAEGEEAVAEGLDAAKLRAAEIMLLAISTGAKAQPDVKAAVSRFPTALKVDSCFGEYAATQYGGLWACEGRGVHAVYGLTREGKKRKDALMEEHGALLTPAIAAMGGSVGTQHERGASKATASKPGGRRGKAGVTPALKAAAEAAEVVLEATAVEADVVGRAQMAITTRESAVVARQLDRMREIRIELDQNVIDVDDDETFDKNKFEARRCAKKEIPDDKEAVKLRAQLEVTQAAEQEEEAAQAALQAAQKKTAAARRKLSSMVNALGDGAVAPPAKRKNCPTPRPTTQAPIR